MSFQGLQAKYNRLYAESAAWKLLRASVAQSHGLSGDALEHIPPSAKPHLYASLAWEAVSRWEGVLDFDTLRAQVIDSLSVRLQRATVPAQHTEQVPFADLWPVDRDGEAHLSSISYFGDSRRTFARDVETDVTLSVLEAVARLDPPATHILERARNLPDERVKWTAARLLEQLEVRYPQHRAGEQ